AMARLPHVLEFPDGAREIAQRLRSDEEAIATAGAQEISGMLVALCKFPQYDSCTELAAALTERIVDDAELRKNFSAHQMSGTLNALSKMPDLPGSAEAARELARQLDQDRSKLIAMNSED
ncbi:hypothetical protein SB861_56815, partial [Paraburkholderia sp. SIMBA_049]